VVESWKEDSCADVKARYALYSVARAAALWCGVTDDLIEQVLDEASPISETGLGRCIVSHPDAPCIEPRCRAISEAIESGSLPHCRENGKLVDAGEHAAYERWHVSGRALKTWIAEEFPNDKPAFLFDDIERNSHSDISADAYRTLKADRDALKIRINNAIESYSSLRDEKKAIEAERNLLQKKLDGISLPNKETNNSALSNSLYWGTLNELANHAIKAYPSWKEKQIKVQKSGNLQEWLTTVIKADNREAEIIKKILSDFFQELR